MTRSGSLLLRPSSFLRNFSLLRLKLPLNKLTTTLDMPSNNDDSAAQQYWTSEIEKQGRDGWYNKALEYWDAQEASVNGVLGGFGHTTGQDLRESGRLLKLLRGRKSPIVLPIVVNSYY